MITIAEARYGRLLVHDTDKYVGRSLIELGEFAEGQVDLFRQIITDQMIVCDVGANIGAHTVVFAGLARAVHAFEPQRDIFHMLCGNVALNDLQNVRCYRNGVGAEARTMRIARVDTAVENNLGAFALDSDGDRSDEVDVIRLEERCHFLKIDVEGWELEVLRGAEPMIRECKPIIYVENDRPERVDEVIAVVRELGYSPYWHITPLFNPQNARGAIDNPWRQNIASVDMLCVQGMRIEGLAPAVAGSIIVEPAAA